MPEVRAVSVRWLQLPQAPAAILSAALEGGKLYKLGVCSGSEYNAGSSRPEPQVLGTTDDRIDMKLGDLISINEK